MILVSVLCLHLLVSRETVLALLHENVNETEIEKEDSERDSPIQSTRGGLCCTICQPNFQTCVEWQ